MEVKLILSFRDRVGLISDVSAIIAKNKINLSSIEAFAGEEVTEIFVNMKNTGNAFDIEEIIDEMKQLPGFLKSRLTQSSPDDDRARWFKVALDNISDGVLAIDLNGEVTAVNQLARDKFFTSDKEMTGRNIKEFGAVNPLLYRGLQGEVFTNERRSIENKNGKLEYLSTILPINDADGEITGVVEIMKNPQEIMHLAKSLPASEAMGFTSCISISPLIDNAVTFAKKIAKTEAIVNIQGESGTGKDLFARAIHFESGRSGPFVPVNCAALPEHLLESELFGYKSGAFTGASKDGRTGLFEVARGGTIFLDEIGEMPLGPQAKILRVIQDRHIRRVGDQNEISVDVRIITATNQKMEEMVKDGRFREDLFYRINVMPIYLPPLRERIEDIRLLSKVFLDEVCHKMQVAPKTISKDAVDKLLQHDWPGNIRELKNVIERAAILCDGKSINDDFIFYGASDSNMTLGNVLRADSALNRETMQSLKNAMASYERDLLTRALAEGDSVRRTAKKLQLSHTALLNKIKAYGLNVKNH